MNTDKLIKTLQAPPCNWIGKYTQTSGDFWAGASPERHAAATIEPATAVMRCTFAPDMPEQVAARNLNYLLTVALVLGGNDVYKWLFLKVKGTNQAKVNTKATFIERELVFTVEIDYSKSTTTLEVKERAE